MRMYRSRRYHGKLRSMESVEDEDNEGPVEVIDIPTATSMIQAIQDNNLEQLQSILNAVTGKNLSDLLVSVALPKRWHKIATSVKSTPLRACISWRNLRAMDLILASKCVVLTEDLSLGLQKVLRHVDGDDELQVIGKLVKNGAEIENPIHLTQAFEGLIREGKVGQCIRIVNIICQSQPHNSLLGMVILSVAKHSEEYQAHKERDDETNQNDEAWMRFRFEAMQTVLLAGFSATDFIMETKSWLFLGPVPFHCLVYMLPLLVQVSTNCPAEGIGWMLRHTARGHYHTERATNSSRLLQIRKRVRQVPKLLLGAGVNLTKMLSAADLPTSFLQDTGLSEISQHYKTSFSSLQDRCKFVIRASITSGNVFNAMEGLNIIPQTTKDFLLLKDVQPLPWDFEESMSESK